MRELLQHDIHYLVDVRSKPYSRFHQQFSKRELKPALKARNITYLWLGYQLGGIPEDVSVYTNGKVDYTKLATKDYFQQGLDRLRTAHQKGVKIAVMCGEKKPHQCHRTHVIGRELTKENIPVLHLLDGKAKDQATILFEANEGRNETDLFGEAGH